MQGGDGVETENLFRTYLKIEFDFNCKMRRPEFASEKWFRFLLPSGEGQDEGDQLKEFNELLPSPHPSPGGRGGWWGTNR
jgi:hypothetical protein